MNYSDSESEGFMQKPKQALDFLVLAGRGRKLDDDLGQKLRKTLKFLNTGDWLKNSGN